MELLESADVWTAEEFLRMSLNGRPHELVQGVAISVRPSSSNQSRVRRKARKILERYGRQSSCGHMLAEGTPVLTKRGPDTVRTADLIFHNDGNWVYDEGEPDLVEDPPEMVLIVEGDNRRAGDLANLAQEYLDFGVPLVLTVHPEQRWVALHREHDGSFALLGENDEIQDVPELPDFHCRIASFFE